MSFMFAFWTVVLLHVLGGILLVLFWPQVLQIKRSVFVQRWYGWIRSKLQPLVSRAFDSWDAHHVADHVYLGNLASACNFDRLRQHKVTHVVTVMIGARPVFPDHLTYHIIHVRDVPEENLLVHLVGAVKFIEDAKKSGGVVLVHCAAGSATIL